MYNRFISYGYQRTIINTKLHLSIALLVVAFVTVAPSLISQQPAQAVTKCEAEKGKSHTWISGCKYGWYNWDVCGLGPTKGDKGQYAEGYEAGWKKGQEHNPNRTGC